MIIEKAVVNYGVRLDIEADEQSMTIVRDGGDSLCLEPDELRDIAAVAGFLGWEGFEHV